MSQQFALKHQIIFIKKYVQNHINLHNILLHKIHSKVYKQFNKIHLKVYKQLNILSKYMKYKIQIYLIMKIKILLSRFQLGLIVKDPEIYWNLNEYNLFISIHNFLDHFKMFGFSNSGSYEKFSSSLYPVKGL